MDTARLSVLIGLAGLLAACEHPGPSAAPGQPSLAAVQPVTCPAHADFVATDEASLVAALAAASPGDVIALDGLIGVSADVSVTTANLTLTCATPGSGLFARAGAGVIELMSVTGRGVTVDRLVLDGSNASDPYFAFNDPDDIDGDGQTGFATDVRFTNNTVTCAPPAAFGTCAFLVATTNAVVSDNKFQASGSFTGVHLQGLLAIRIDGTRIERNTIVATAPSAISAFGGLRVRDGSNVVVANNVVQGPWSNSIATFNLAGNLFESNRLEGAISSGILFNGFNGVDNLFRDNNVTGAGFAGILAFLACRNSFVGNNLNGNAGDLALLLASTTGANTFIGNRNVVVDDGNFDCNGDGVADPNVITGPGLARRGGPQGLPVDTLAVVTRHRVRVR